MKAMEEEAEKLKALQSEVEQQITADVTSRKFQYFFMNLTNYILAKINFPTMEEKMETDNRSIYVGQVFLKVLKVLYNELRWNTGQLRKNSSNIFTAAAP